MNQLIAFFNPTEIVSPGLLAGEPTKGPLIKTIEFLKPDRVLLILKADSKKYLENLSKIAGCKIEHLLVEGCDGSLSNMIDCLQQHAAALFRFGPSALLNTGSPQQRAALWVLKHNGILQGQMFDPPPDYSFAIPAPLAELKVAERAQRFDTSGDLGASPHWSAVAAQVGCIGKSPRYCQMMEEAAVLATYPTPILLYGETGCGKEVLAHFIHQMSPRAQKPFVAVNCAALPETLAESILFGHEKGSFTGAYRRQKGKFELSDGGTLFLDELGELSLANQAKLLRVLETRQVDPLGGRTR